MDRVLLYDIIYALIARDGREASLFGQQLGHARDTFEQSLAGTAFPELWFELPLAGEPWFDLHVLTSRETLDSEAAAATQTLPGLFAWFASASGVRQLALSWDVGSGGGAPAAQLLLDARTGTFDPEITCAFLDAAGRADATLAYRTFVQSIPQGWYACYTGVFPNRLGNALRIECIPRRSLQAAYAQDPTLLEEHLRATGFQAFDDTLVSRCQELARTPFALEFQFDVGLDGRALDTIGASLRFAMPPGTPEWQSFALEGPTREIMDRVKSWELADDRWQLLAGTAFAKRVALGAESSVLYSCPTFVKLRWRDGAPLDAKAYLIAGMQ